MYYQSYEDYMRDLLGYNNPYFTNTPTYYENIPNTSERNMEYLYPELYKTIYPIVGKVCDKNTKPLNADTIEELTAEVFVNLEANGNDLISANFKAEKVNTSRQKDETRQRNPILQDLIRILIIRELLERPIPPRPRPRPPFPGPRPRPPFPGHIPRTNYDENLYY